MVKPPTVYDVARRAGVSIATVSFAFRQPHRVRPATLTTVMEAAQALGYLPSASARGLATGRTGVIGLYAFDYLIDPPAPSATGRDDGYRSFPLYVDEVQHGVELECRKLGYALLVGGASPSPSMPAIVDIAGRIDGLITFAGSLTPELVRTVAGRVPVIALGSDEAGGPIGDDQAAGRIDTVRVDDGDGIRRLVEHLLEVHHCRRPVFVGEPRTVEMRVRYDAFAAALGRAGLVAPPPLASRAGLDETTERVVRSRLRHGGTPDAFVCATDQEALVTLDVVRAAGHRVGEDVAVTGFDDIVAARLSRPALTTVRQPMEEIGRVAVRRLAALMADGERSPEPAALPVDLVVRRSCGCPAV